MFSRLIQLLQLYLRMQCWVTDTIFPSKDQQTYFKSENNCWWEKKTRKSMHYVQQLCKQRVSVSQMFNQLFRNILISIF